MTMKLKPGKLYRLLQNEIFYLGHSMIKNYLSGTILLCVEVRPFEQWGRKGCTIYFLTPDGKVIHESYTSNPPLEGNIFGPCLYEENDIYE